MSLSLEERNLLERISSAVIETKDGIASLTRELILLRRVSDGHDVRLDRHDYRIGALEQHVGISGSYGSVFPRGRSRSVVPAAPVPRTPEDLGLHKGENTGSFITKDAQALVERFAEQEIMRKGAEEALERAREEAEFQEKRTDRLLKRLAWAGSAFFGIATVAAYLYVHFHL